MSWTDKLYYATLSFSTSGDNTVIAAPSAGQRIAIDFITLLPTAATVIQMKDGTTNYGGAFDLDAKQGFLFENAQRNHDGIITLSPGAAFVVNSTVATQVSGFVRYRILDNN